jgi:hypothetical protein
MQQQQQLLSSFWSFPSPDQQCQLSTQHSKHKVMYEAAIQALSQAVCGVQLCSAC